MAATDAVAFPVLWALSPRACVVRWHRNRQFREASWPSSTATVQYCGGGELYGLLMSQPNKRLSEAHMKFYVAEILLALQYLHLLGFVYRCCLCLAA